jgi:dihydroorotase
VSLSRWVDYADLIEKVTYGPRNILKLELPTLQPDARANLTLFDPDRQWTFDEKSNFSKSANSPWFGKKITGKVVGVFNNTRQWTDL